MDANGLRGLLLLLLFYLSLTAALPPGGLSFSSSYHPNTKYMLEINQSASTDTDMDNFAVVTTSSPPSSSSDSTPQVFSNSNTSNSSSIASPSTPSDSLSLVSSSVSYSSTPTPTPTTPTSSPSSSSSGASSSDMNIDEISSTNSTHRNNSRVETTEDESALPEHPIAEPLQKQSIPGNGTVELRGKCNTTDQCKGEHVDCRVGICKCSLGYLPRTDNGELCGVASAHHVEVPQADPTMIGVVIGLALMSVTLCVVLRLFAKARFRENRTIFNTPNPRLMNVSLLKGSKTLLRGNSAGQRSRRGSQASIASGQLEGEVPVSSNPPPSSRPRPHRQLSTDTTNTDGNSTPSSRPISSVNKNKFRQDSVASASNV